MKKSVLLQTSFALLLGSLLAIFSMVLHPTGGSLEHIRAITPMIQVTHALAVIGLAILLIGLVQYCWISIPDQNGRLIPVILLIFGGIFVTLAGTLNGFVLPQIAQLENSITPESAINLAQFNHFFNRALTNNFIGFFSAGFAAQGFLAIRNQSIPKAVSVYGILVGLASLLMLFFGTEMRSVKGFGLLVLALTSYAIVCGLHLLVQSRSSKQLLSQ